MQDLNSTMIFVKVVSVGSFTRAAKLLGVPKSTISDKVAQLERELGVTLLTRTTRKLKLTDVGEEFFRKAEPGINQLQAAGEEASQAQRAPTGVLRITGPAETLTFHHVLEAVAEYRGKFPQVKVEMDFTDRTVDLVAEGYDIAIRGGSLSDSTLKARRIGVGRQILIASDSYLKKAETLRQPHDLLEHSCLKHISARTGNIWVLRSKRGKMVRVHVPETVSVNSYTGVISLAVLGQGIGLVPHALCLSELSTGTLVRVIPEWSTSETPISLVYPAQKFSSAKVREMIPLLEKHIRKILQTEI
jgi:DNA-binding transcriptional LysR family regulator